MKKVIIFLFILLVGSVLWAQNRYALVIGNANYPGNELPNAINDTNNISSALRELGYQVVLRQDLQEHTDMVREISAFIARLRSNRNSEGFFWYAGHAEQIEGESYLFPLKVDLASDDLTKATSYSVNELVRQLGTVRNKVNVVVLDACRTVRRTGNRGDISRVIIPVQLSTPDLVLIYSTASGTVASDGAPGGNSPFAQAFLQNIRSTEPLLIMIAHVTSDTLNLTNQRQRPFYSGGLDRENAYYSLNPSGVRPSPNPNPNPNPTPTPSMVRIQGGTFTMGSPANESGRQDNEGPQRQVTVSSFSMGRYEVTQREYEAVMGTNPSHFKGPNLPVENVSWFDAVEYCNRLSQREGLTLAYTISGSGNNRTVTWNRSANGYRLPTEAEWEYACRAGTTTAYSVVNTTISNNEFFLESLRLAKLAQDSSEYGDYAASAAFAEEAERYSQISIEYIASQLAWFSANSNSRTHEVGEKPPNAWGLYDMHGNVFEWCWDWFGNYLSGTQTDPVGPSSGTDRVLRGGNWGSNGKSLRSAYRFNGSPGAMYQYGIIGFRLVRP